MALQVALFASFLTYSYQNLGTSEIDRVKNHAPIGLTRGESHIQSHALPLQQTGAIVVYSSAIAVRKTEACQREGCWLTGMTLRTGEAFRTTRGEEKALERVPSSQHVYGDIFLGDHNITILL